MRFKQVIGIFRRKMLGGDQLHGEAEQLGIPREEILYSAAFDVTQLWALSEP